MDGVWRGLRDVGKTVSGVLGVRSGEGEDRPVPPPPTGDPVALVPPADEAGTGSAAPSVPEEGGGLSQADLALTETLEADAETLEADAGTPGADAGEPGRLDDAVLEAGPAQAAAVLAAAAQGGPAQVGAAAGQQSAVQAESVEEGPVQQETVQQETAQAGSAQDSSAQDGAEQQGAAAAAAAATTGADDLGEPTVAATTAAEPTTASEPTAQVDGPTAEATTEPPAPADPDPVLAAAVELAREAALEVAGTAVGEHLGSEVDGPADGGPALTHSFATTDPAYRGWRWAVTVARALDSEHVTVDEVVLLPGAGALLAPAWVPWSERLQPGDLSAGDLLPPPADDPRLVAAYADPEAELADEAHWELGLGRPRVLSVEGRADAAERWYDVLAGPDAPVAKQAPGRCNDCGFLVLLAGSLRSTFGVCANAYAPDDGRVVALQHGCGAHSETVVDGAHAATAGMAVEDDEFELVTAGEDS